MAPAVPPGGAVDGPVDRALNCGRALQAAP